MIECRSISRTLSARSYTTVLPAVARRSPATSTPPENLNARMVVASVGCHDFWCGVATGEVEVTVAGASTPLRLSNAGKSRTVAENRGATITGEGTETGRVD